MYGRISGSADCLAYVPDMTKAPDGSSAEEITTNNRIAQRRFMLDGKPDQIPAGNELRPDEKYTQTTIFKFLPI
jgi:hypothetical protein